LLLEVIWIILNSARDAFIQVGVWVALMLIIFGYIEYATKGRIVGSIRRGRRWQPLIGAFLGVTPGCGGAIFVMPLFVNGTVTFGTVIATLVATMGDSSWVIIAGLPKDALLIHTILFVSGIIVGYIVDWLKIGINLVRPGKEIEETSRRLGQQYAQAENSSFHPEAFKYEHLESTEQVDILHAASHVHPDSISYNLTHNFYMVIWIAFSIGFIISFFTQLQIAAPEQVDAIFGGFPIYNVVGVVGTLLCIIWMVLSDKFLRDDTYEQVEEKLESMRETLIHSAEETAFVVAWVTAAYIVFELFLYLTNIDLAYIVNRAGIISVIAAAAIGLIPGCGPQIITTSLYIKGVIPFAAVISNALSQDGDALFPLLSLHRKSALYATIITTIPAIIIGCIFYLLGIGGFR
jgi:hypothetical protein